MARWNKDLMTRLPEPIELAGDGRFCYGCRADQ